MVLYLKPQSIYGFMFKIIQNVFQLTFFCIRYLFSQAINLYDSNYTKFASKSNSTKRRLPIRAVMTMFCDVQLNKYVLVFNQMNGSRIKIENNLVRKEQLSPHRMFR